MSRVLALAVLLLVLAPAGAAADQTARGKARLQILGGASLIVRGAQFVPGERVKVSVAGDHSMSKRTVANSRGAFAVRFSMPFDRCNSSLRVLATGDRGSRASAKRPEMMCPPRL